MARESGTRSGLLWEVERLLDECKELPQVLLMENVPDVIGKKNFKHFAIWTSVLEQFGYKNYYNVLNAKEVGYPEPVPQNRERCFMVSILGDYFYEFPQPTELKTRLKDVLEKRVHKKYFYSHSVNVERERLPIRSAAEDAEALTKSTVGILLSKTRMKETEIAGTIQAHYSKGITGFENQFDNGVLEEWKKK